MTVLFTGSYFTAVDSNGSPVSGAKAYFYEAGTSTPVDTYSDSGLTSTNAIPIVADAAGRFPTIFLPADDYKIIIKDASDNIIDTQDDYSVVSPASFSSSYVVNAQTGTSYTVQTTDKSKLVTHSNANAIAVTLPQAESVNFPDGWFYEVWNKGAGAVTITPTTSTINGSTSIVLLTNQGATVYSDGTNYQIQGIYSLSGTAVNAQTGTTYTVLFSDRDKLATFTNTAAVAVTLPQANSTTFPSGWSFEATNIGPSTVTITPTTSTIGGLSTLVLTRGERAKITSDGTNYQSVTYGDYVGKESTGYSATAPQGWLVQNGDTVGSAASGATKAAAIYEALYRYLWDNVSDSYAAVSTGRGASAAADFAANKTIALPTMADKSVYGVGTYATGQTAGSATTAITGTVATSGATTISTSTMPAHTHGGYTGGGGTGPRWFDNTGGSPLATESTGSGGSHTHTAGAFTGDAASVVHPVRGKYFYIKY